MTTEQHKPEPTITDLILAVQRLEAVARAIASQNPPNWKRPLRSYKNGWVEAIGATAIASDEHGPTVVAWCGHTYTRRTGSNAKYGATIWFSRAVGKGEGDTVNYARLITFEDGAAPTAEPLPAYVIDKLG